MVPHRVRSAQARSMKKVRVRCVRKRNLALWATDWVGPVCRPESTPSSAGVGRDASCTWLRLYSNIITQGVCGKEHEDARGLEDACLGWVE